jgi:AP-1 complex subunit gamma-1
MVEAGAYVKEDVLRGVVVLITNAPELHGYAVRSYYRALRDNFATAQPSLVTSAAWFLGVLSHHVFRRLWGTSGRGHHHPG